MANLDVILPTERSNELPAVRSLSIADLQIALRKGLDDFWAMPTYVVFLCAIYPVVGILLFFVTFSYDLIPLLYPLASGFALIGPFAAIGLYELSRRRELGLDVTWGHAFDVVHSPSLRPIIGLAVVLLITFAVWMAIAQWIYIANFGDRPLVSPLAFAKEVLTTREGLNLIIVGNAVGFLFALATASVSVIAFPLLLDRDVGLVPAVATSLRVVARNPVTMAIWFLFVASALLIGSALLLVGLAVVLPVLGHATWHLYRRAVEPDSHPRPDYSPRVRGRRYAAEFPASLFFRSSDVDESTLGRQARGPARNGKGQQ